VCSSIPPRGAVACQGLRWQVDGDQLAADNPSRIRPARPANTRGRRHLHRRRSPGGRRTPFRDRASGWVGELPRTCAESPDSLSTEPAFACTSCAIGEPLFTEFVHDRPIQSTRTRCEPSTSSSVSDERSNTPSPCSASSSILRLGTAASGFSVRGRATARAEPRAGRCLEILMPEYLTFILSTKPLVRSVVTPIARGAEQGRDVALVVERFAHGVGCAHALLHEVGTDEGQVVLARGLRHQAVNVTTGTLAAAAASHAGCSPSLLSGATMIIFAPLVIRSLVSAICFCGSLLAFA